MAVLLDRKIPTTISSAESGDARDAMRWTHRHSRIPGSSAAGLQLGLDGSWHTSSVERRKGLTTSQFLNTVIPLYVLLVFKRV
jgi:hypothetical protein